MVRKQKSIVMTGQFILTMYRLLTTWNGNLIEYRYQISVCACGSWVCSSKKCDEELNEIDDLDDDEDLDDELDEAEDQSEDNSKDEVKILKIEEDIDLKIDDPDEDQPPKINSDDDDDMDEEDDEEDEEDDEEIDVEPIKKSKNKKKKFT